MTDRLYAVGLTLILVISRRGIAISRDPRSVGHARSDEFGRHPAERRRLPARRKCCAVCEQPPGCRVAVGGGWSPERTAARDLVGHATWVSSPNRTQRVRNRGRSRER